MRLFTIGHSNLTLKAFLEILQAHEVDHLVDIRTVPKSRYVPWFNQSALKKDLCEKKIEYTHFKSLGGFRKAKKDSLNLGWHNLSFRGFADYMQTKEFFEGLKALNRLVQNYKKVAIMCSEAVPWRCHRLLIADAEIIRRIRVFDILNKNTLKEHQLTSFAVVNRHQRPMQIYYPDSSQRESN